MEVDKSAEFAEATATGEPVEVETARNADTTTFANPDGTTTVRIFAAPIRTLDQDGDWVDIDPTLVADGDGIHPRVAGADVFFSDGGVGKEMASLETEAGRIAFVWPGRLPKPELVGTIATYRDVYPGVDLELEAFPNGYAKRFVVRERPSSPLVLSFPVELSGLSLAQREGPEASPGSTTTTVPGLTVEATEPTDLELKNADGEVVAVGAAPRMWGAVRDPQSDEPTREMMVDYTLAPDGSLLELRPDPRFLADPEVALPIVIDPSTNLTTTADTHVQSNSTVSKWSDVELKSGTYDDGTTKARSLIKFNTSTVTGKLIITANIYLYEFHSWSCTAKEVRAYRVTSAFNSSTIWSNQPGTGSMAGSTTVAKGYSGSCPDGWITIQIPGLVQQWADGTYPNDGVRIMAASETDSYGWKKFNSADASTNKPYLEVNYDSVPAVPSSLSPAAGFKTNDLTPALTATYSDPDGGTGTLFFEIANNSTGTLVASGSKTNVASGSAGTWSPTSNLTSQTTYKWRVKADDGIIDSAWTAWRTIIPDNTVPAAAAVSSTTHSVEATWYPNDDPALSWTATDPTGITGYSYILDQVSNTTPDTTAEGTGTTITYSNKADGVWYFHIRAKDGAGNWGTTRHRTIRVDDTASAAPTVTSSTHPNQTHWYVPADGATFNDPTFSWSGLTDTSGITGYSYTVDQASTTTPDTTSDGTGTSTTITDIGGGGSGVFYFHVRAQNGSGLWGPASHYKVQVDTGGITFANPLDESTLAGTVTLQADTGPNATGAEFGVWDGSDWISLGVSTDLDTSEGYRWSFEWDTTTVTPGPYQLQVKPVFGAVTGQATPGPMIAVDQTRLGVNPWWTFQDLGGGAQVNLATGNVVVSGSDLSVPTPAGDLAFTRTYNSQGASFSGPLGWGWDFSLPTDAAPAGFTTLTHITSDGEYIKVLDSTGEPLYFLLEEGTGAWLPESGAEGVTVAEDTYGATPVWKVTDTDGTLYYFESHEDPLEDPDLPGMLIASQTAASGSSETTYAYNGYGELTGVANGPKSFTLTWSSGRITSIDAGFVTTSGPEISFGYTNGHLTSVTDERTGLIWAYGYDANHQITTITPPGQAAYTLAYTGNKLSAVTRPIPGGGTASTSLSYSTWSEGAATTLTTPRSHAWTYHFDASSRPRELDPPLGATQHTTWDAHNQALTTQTPAEAEAGVSTTNLYSSAETPCNLSGATEGANDGTDLCSVTKPGLGTTHYEYDEGLGETVYNLVTRQTNPDGTYVVYEYDSNGLAARKPSEERSYSAGDTLLQTEGWVYDANGNVTSETRPDTSMTTFTYSGGLLTAINGPGVTPDRSFTYDDWGNVRTEVWPDSVIENQYDSATRLEWTEATSSTLEDVDRVTTSYDETTGLVDTVGDTNHTVSYTYDTWGRVLTETDGLGETTTFVYDSESNLTSRSDSKGTTSFDFDALGRVTEVDDTGVGATTTAYSTSSGSLVSTTSYPNGVTATTTARAGVGDVQTVSYEGPGGMLGVFTRSYDTMGRVEAESGPLVDREYNYDDLGRLVEARDYDPVSSNLVETREYSFDENTNRTELTVTPAGESPSTTTYQIATDGSDRLTSINSGTALTYDLNGNTLSMPGRSMVWNAANRLASATAGSTTVEYGLDPLGRTLTRTSTGGTEDSQSEYHFSTDADTPSWVTDTVESVATTTRYVNGGGGLLATQQIGGAVTYPLYSPHGDTWAWTDELGDITGTAVYDEYGNPLQAPSGEPGADRYGWLGGYQRELDPEVGLTLMGVRGYDPTLGRFLTVDPIRGGSANDYDYTAGDPINGYDLDGHACWNPFKKECRRNILNRLRFLKNAPWSAIAVAWAHRNGGSCARRAGGMIVCAGMRSGYGPRAGMTIGNVFLTKLKQSDVDAALLRHEARHATQWAYLGTLMPQTYLFAQLAGTCRNFLEVGAVLRDGRYTSC